MTSYQRQRYYAAVEAEAHVKEIAQRAGEHVRAASPPPPKHPHYRDAREIARAVAAVIRGEPLPCVR